jgi:biotin carboxylase
VEFELKNWWELFIILGQPFLNLPVIISTMLRSENATRILVLTTPRSYRLQAFREAAERLGIDITSGMDLPLELADQWPGVLALDFRNLDSAVRQIVAFAQELPLSGILAVDDSGSELAAAASQALDLPHNQPSAAKAARDKALMRQILKRGGLPTPWFRKFNTSDDPAEVARQVPYPCVIKPINLNGSRGVIRADSPAELTAAIQTLRKIIEHPLADGPQPYLVEAYIPGIEIALEGLLDNGRLQVLALFDKPDPLMGPYFEETIYVTPSRLPSEIQDEVFHVTNEAVRALGLSIGPVHAEMRINDQGVWIVELAGRSIGGLCSQVLRFGMGGSLEELILGQMCGIRAAEDQKEPIASGVMMIPIPSAGILRQVRGVEEAVAVPLIDNIELTARLNYPLVPLPEGDSYLGFIFARGDTPEGVESALREAHSRLEFAIDPFFELLPV